MKFIFESSVGGTLVGMPDSEFEEVEVRTVLFKSIEKKTKRNAYPTLEEAKTQFQVCWDNVEFVIRSMKYGTLEVVFKNKKYVGKYAEETLENEEWFLFPNYLGRVGSALNIGGIRPNVRAE